MSDALTKASEKAPIFSASSDSWPTDLSTRVNDDLLMGAISFLLLRYTGKKSLELPYSNAIGNKVRKWDLTDATTLGDLQSRFEDRDKEPSSQSDELSEWNPGFTRDDGAGSPHFRSSDPDYPQLLFSASTGPEPILRIHSTHTKHTQEFLKQLLDHWIHSIRLLTEQSNQKALTSSILTADEHQRMIFEWNDHDRPSDNGRFDFEEFDLRVEQVPDKTAISSETESLTYRELQQKTNRVAHFLQEQGVGPEVIVGIYLTRSVEFVVCLVGLIKSGGAFLPLDPNHPKDRKEYMIKDSQVPFIITSKKFVDSLPEGNFKVLLVEEFFQLLDSYPVQTPDHGLKSGNMSYLFYTSGSTGQPKGVIMTHTYQDKQSEETKKFPIKGEKVLLRSSTGFTLILLETFSPIKAGGEIVVVPKDQEKDASWMLENIREQKIETLNMVPSMLSFLLQEGLETCTSLKKVYTVGERLPVSVQREFFRKLPDAKLFVFYGCTEAPAATFREVKKDEDYGDRIILGTPNFNKKVYLLDEFGVPVPVGVTGEIFVGGKVSRGYIHNERLTQERFTQDPFLNREGARMYQTGDLGRYLPDGSLEYIGRTDFQVQIRGIRIELGEIESCLNAHEQISDAVVIAKENLGGQTIIVAYYTLTGMKAPSEEELRTLIRSKLPDYMVPARFIVLDTIPVNPNGKIDRLNFPDPESIPKADFGFIGIEVGSRNEMEIRTIFFHTLGIGEMLNSESFFDIGGDSMLAMTALNQINKKFNVSISLPDFYRNSTVEQVCAMVQQQGYKSEFEYLVSLREGSGTKNLFMVSCRENVDPFISEDFNIYLLRGTWYNKKYDFSDTMDTVVKRYVEEIQKVDPEGPYYMAGFSLGGLIAHQAACHLQEQGKEVKALHCVDPSPPQNWNEWLPKNNFQAIWSHIRKKGLKEGAGIIVSYIRTFLGMPHMERHRVLISMEYSRVLMGKSEYKTFNGDIYLYPKINYGQKSIDAWHRKTTGNVSQIQMPTEDHHDIDRNPLLQKWCKNIKA